MQNNGKCDNNRKLFHILHYVLALNDIIGCFVLLYNFFKNKFKLELALVFFHRFKWASFNDSSEKTYNTNIHSILMIVLSLLFVDYTAIQKIR